AIPGQGIRVKLIGKPNQAALLFWGADVLATPLSTLYGEWYLESPVIPILLGHFPWTGLIEFTVRIPPAYPSHAIIPLQAYARGELTNLCTIQVQ
ncbi:MAG: hypothetical protein ABIK28_09550, partial [Planctomycetota bacterium]